MALNRTSNEYHVHEDTKLKRRKERGYQGQCTQRYRANRYGRWRALASSQNKLIN